MLRPKSGQWMTFEITVEMKNTTIGPEFKSFLAKYFGDWSRPFRIKCPLIPSQNESDLCGSQKIRERVHLTPHIYITKRWVTLIPIVFPYKSSLLL